MTEYTLKRSRRKTVGIYINESGAVEVRAPLYTSKRDIDAFVERQSEWIKKHSSIRKNECEQRKNFTVDADYKPKILGKNYPIVLSDEKRISFDGERVTVYSGLDSDGLRLSLVNLYKSTAKRYIVPRTLHFASSMGVEPSDIKINSAKKRWGSCSGKNSLNFSWRLILADGDAVDYVIVHELCHIKHHDHSPEFWKEVEKVLPDYKRREKLLKTLQAELEKQNWD